MTGLILPSTVEKPTGVVAFMAGEKDGIIQVIDMWADLSPDAKADTSKVTCAPQSVINELARRGYAINDWPIMYLDENGIWDRIKVHNGQFDNFQVFHATRWQEVLEKMLSSGIMTARDMKREPIANKTFRV